jgi:D-serine deaminase-like pyridoxal phosphate-dependent protein
MITEDRRAAQAVGRARGELTTPALILDLDLARANIAAMARRTRELGTALRPHVKVHKSPQLAHLQVQAGAQGITTATVWEARAMAQAGLDDILVANEVVGDAPMRALAALAGERRVLALVDDADNARRLGAVAAAMGVQVGLLVDVDTGMGRCGVRTAADAAALAQIVVGTPGLELGGVSGYEGHCMLEPDPARRVQRQRAAMDVLGAAVDAIADVGLPCEIVSAGGTGTYHLTGADPRVTELQAGSYAVMDLFHSRLVPGFEVAVTVLATVISRHGDDIVLDAGQKAVGGLAPRISGVAADAAYVNEEHTGFRLPPGTAAPVGTVVELQLGYAPTAINLFDAYHVVEGGVVTDLWPVMARYGVETLA